MSIKIQLLCWCFLGIFSAATAQQTYYVATDGSNENDGTNLNAPWRSINYAAQQAQAGDVILIRGGTYRERVQVTNSGAPGAEIIFRNYADEKPIIDGSTLSFPDDYARRGLFEVNTARYIRLEGLSAVNANGLSLNGCGFLVNGPSASHITISNCSTNDTPSSGIAAWGNTGPSDYGGVTNLVIEQCIVTGAMNGGFQEHITIADGVENFEVRYNTVRDGQIPHPNNYPIGIDAKIDVRSGKIYGNKVHNLKSSNGIYVDAWDDEAYDIEIFNNEIYDVDGIGIVVGAESGGTAHNVEVFNNIVYRAGTDGLKVSASYGNPTIYDTYWFNNTVFQCRSSMWVEGNSEAVNIQNNIFSDNQWNNGIYVYSSNKANITASYNLIDAYAGRSWDDPVMEEIRGTNAIEQVPLFVDAANADFRLQSTSPAIDAGTATEAPATDFAGNTRPVGAGYDVGAYEYGSSTANSPNEIAYTIRARGLQGTERMALQIGGQTVQSWTVGTSAQDYSYTGSESGSVRVAFTNDQGKGHDLVVNKLRVGGAEYLAKEQAVNTGVWQNKRCGGTESGWLHCSGYIEFAVGAANARQVSPKQKPILSQTSSEVLIYPNPSRTGSFTVMGATEKDQVEMYDLQGRKIVLIQTFEQQQLRIRPQNRLPVGLYILQVKTVTGALTQYKLAIE